MATAPTANPSESDKPKSELFFHSGFFLAALLFHLILFAMVATWVIFPAFHPPVDEFNQTYVPASTPPPPPPPPTQATQVPTHTVAPPTQTISVNTPAPTFNVPMPDFSHQTTPDTATQQMTKVAPVPTQNNLNMRLAKIRDTVTQNWGRDANNIRDANGDPHNVTAKFPLYLASYADGDWGCNVNLDKSGKIERGSLPNLVAKINEWSHGKITGNVIPQPLNIGGPELLAKKPPFIFFTGHKDFHLTDTEIQNLRDYLQVGGCVWGDNALAGRGSRFDVAFRREMKRVVPDADKNFVPYAMTDDVFIKSWFPISAMPTGMNYFAEPIEHLDIDGKLAIIYTLNDYSDMMTMRINPGDTTVTAVWKPKPGQLNSNMQFMIKANIFYRNYQLDSCLASQQLGMNILGYLLVRFDKELMLAP